MGLKKSLKKILIFRKSKYFLILINAEYFLFASRQTFLRYSSNFNSLSVVTTKSLTFRFSYILLWPVLAHQCVNLFPDMKKVAFI